GRPVSISCIADTPRKLPRARLRRSIWKKWSLKRLGNYQRTAGIDEHRLEHRHTQAHGAWCASDCRQRRGGSEASSLAMGSKREIVLSKVPMMDQSRISAQSWQCDESSSAAKARRKAGPRPSADNRAHKYRPG